MTGTMHGFLIYRLQEKLRNAGVEIDYNRLSYAITETLMQLDRAMKDGEYIELPTGTPLFKRSPEFIKRVVKGVDNAD